MTRLPLTLSLLVAISIPALAGQAQAPRGDTPASRPNHYWMSRDFQRLVFWQAPDQAGTAQRR